MLRNKPRLELALYLRPKHPQKPHYALLIAPKITSTATTTTKTTQSGPISKHHAKNTLLVDENGQASTPWRYEHATIPDIAAEPRLLVRVIIAKVIKPRDRVERIMRESVPVPVPVPVSSTTPSPSEHPDPDLHKAQADEAEKEGEEEEVEFNCRTWVRAAFEALRVQGAISRHVDSWDEVQKRALEYVEQKREQKRWDGSWGGEAGVPVLDLVDGGREVVG